MKSKSYSYIVSFRNSKIGMKFECCSNQKGLLGIYNNSSKSRSLSVKMPLKNAFHMNIIECNCNGNKYYKNNGYCFDIGLIGIKSNKKHLWDKLFEFFENNEGNMKR